MRPFFILAVVALTGCVAGKHSYTPPASTGMSASQNWKEVDRPKDEVWKDLIAGLGAEFFVINNLDKSSGFINVSYSGDPQQYVDGGEYDFMVSNLRGKRDYRFPAAKANTEYEIFQNGILMTLTRQLNLEGRINVIVTEVSRDRTKVQVNTRYILTLSVSGHDATGRPLRPSSSNITFNTGTSAHSSAGTVFRATGELEHSILAMVK